MVVQFVTGGEVFILTRDGLIEVRNGKGQQLAFSGKPEGLWRVLSGNYSVLMTRRLHNWTYKQVTLLLKQNGFVFLKPLFGSHEAWVKRGNGDKADRRVEVNITRKSYPLPAVKRFVRQSGIPQEKWIEWGSS